jgi:hypothetical protein
MRDFAFPRARRYLLSYPLLLFICPVLSAQESGALTPPLVVKVHLGNRDAITRIGQLSDGDLNFLPSDMNETPEDQLVDSPETYTMDERLENFERSFVSVQSLVGPALGAGIAQSYNSPHEWGGATPGFGRRLASSNATSILGRTIGFGVAALDQEDSRFYPSTDTSVRRRAGHAIAGTFISRTPGGTMPAFSRFAGIYLAAFISNSWQPRSQNGPGHALLRGSITLSSSAGFQLLQEFWPDFRSALHWRK